MSRPKWTAALSILVGSAVLIGTGGVAGANSHGSKTLKPATSATPRLTVVPVGTCASETARGGSGPVWIPTELPAVLSSSAVKSLEFYSVGSESVLGPQGWDCAQLFATDGSAQLAVYKPGSPNPVKTPAPTSSGAQLVDAIYDYTGHVPGYDLACAYFPAIKHGTEPCTTSVPAGEQVKQLTPDVVRITDPAGVKGHLDGSGGPQPAVGIMIVPQSTTLSSVPITEVSCSLRTTSLCTSILNDFVVRQFEVPTSSTG